ncbi:hypothetical protein PENSPDRAFT_694118 [Peniophora sp. CONT]|nr:hypothetical protein PENSPDRAFT_694118 [Peniophora sp. CONT]
MDRALPPGPPPAPALARKSLSGLKFKKKSVTSSNAPLDPALPSQHPPKRPASPSASSSREPQAPTPVPAPKPLKKLPPDSPPRLAVKWRFGTSLVCINTEYVPGDPGLLARETVHMNDDGLWGWQEISRQPQPLEPSMLYLTFTRVPRSESEAMFSTEFGVPQQEDTVCGTTVNGRARPNVFYLRAESGLPRQDKKPTVNPKNLYSPVNAQVPHKTLEDPTDLTKQMEVPIKTLESNMMSALELFRAAFKDNRGLDKSSVQYHVTCKVKPLFGALSMMRHSWGLMTWQGLESWADYVACMRAHQRSHLFVDAYIEFLEVFLPPAYSERLRERVGRREKGARRRVILSGKQTEIYLHFLKHLEVPVYALVSEDEYFVPGPIYWQHQPPHCSVVPSLKFSHFPVRDLPLTWYAPEGIAWNYVEAVVLHGLAHPRSSIKASQKHLKLYAAVEKKSDASKKRKLDDDAKFQEQHPGVDLPADLYRLQAASSPTLQRSYDLKRDLRDESEEPLYEEWGQEDWDMDEFYRYGHPLLLGEARTKYCRKHPDKELRDGILFCFNSLCLLFWLIELVSPARLEAEGIPAVWHIAGEHHTPNIREMEECNAESVYLAFDIVMGGFDVCRTTWFPPIYTASDEHWDNHCKQWLCNLAKLLLMTDGVDALDERLKRDWEWLSASELAMRTSSVEALGDDTDAMERLEEHVLLRYYLASFQSGQFPVKFLQVPSPRHCESLTDDMEKITALLCHRCHRHAGLEPGDPDEGIWDKEDLADEEDLLGEENLPDEVPDDEGSVDEHMDE